MAKQIRYTEEFKGDAVSQIKDRGYSVKEVSDRLGVSAKSLYDWIKRYQKPASVRLKETDQALCANISETLNPSLITVGR